MWLFSLAVLIPTLIWYSLTRLERWFTARKFHQIRGTEPPVKLSEVSPPQGGSFYKETMQAFREHRLLELIQRRHEAAGYTYQTTTLGSHVINTSEPENIKAILATSFEDYSMGNRMAAVGPFLGPGVFTNDFKDWEFSRAITRPNFVKAQISNLSLFEKYIQQLIAHVPKDSSTIELQDLFYKLSFDISSKVVFGQSVQSFTAPEDSDQARFAAAYDYASAQVVRRLQLGFFLRFYYNRDFNKACHTVHEFADSIIARALADRQKQGPKAGKENEENYQYNFLEGLLDSVTDPHRLRSELLNILQAGRDTTAALLSHIFYILARRKDVWDKLELEVLDLNGKAPTYEHLRNMTYLRYVLNETLRLWPVAPLNSRTAIRDTILPTGGGPDHTSPMFIPKGQKLSYPQYAMHRRKDIYGPDADEFHPERWADPNFRPGWAYIPFSGGPRICVGQQFALTEAGYTVVRLMQTFKAVEQRDFEPYQECVRITLSLLNGVKVGLIPREKSGTD